MRTVRQVLAVLAIVGMALVGCDSDSGSGSKKAAGEACTLTEEGAAECSSNVCLQVICNSGSEPTICTGNACESNDDCPSGSECVPDQNVCVPASVCD